MRISKIICAEMAGDRHDNLGMKFFSIKRSYIFNNESFDFLNLGCLPYGGLRFRHYFKTHYYFIAFCTQLPR